MTDIMSEAFGRELAARTTFEKEAVWLPLLAVHSLNAGNGVIRGMTFTDCVIEGPALMVVIDGVTLEDCNLGVATDPRSLFYKPYGPVMVGGIGFSDTRFVRCRFVQVGFTGHPTVIENMADELVSAQSTSAKVQN